jgi:hypothetical protein
LTTKVNIFVTKPVINPSRNNFNLKKEMNKYREWGREKREKEVLFPVPIAKKKRIRPPPRFQRPQGEVRLI